ncbi:MAG: four-helix bundle copper-binding protein [Anaerolineae bacterium]|jgi:hypothetical protein|nr:four-helix bundle copper-binding protein [Anaerolineae bacterium]
MNQPDQPLLQQCIDACEQCHTACLALIPHCLSMGGEHASLGHITLLLDCSQISQTSADFMLRRSHHHEWTCAACAEICDRCAACESIDSEDTKMMTCAQTCRDCARVCREMVEMTQTSLLGKL